MDRCRHFGPLYIQKPFYPEGESHPHIYILHPPGGIVSGDELNVNIRIGPEAGGLITTPGASRFYNAAAGAPEQKQTIEIEVAEKAYLEWFPMETIVFDGARVDLSTKISLASNSSVCFWDICCMGLPASGQNFVKGGLKQEFIVLAEGMPVFADKLTLGENFKAFGFSNAGLRGFTVSGFLVSGPVSDGEHRSEITSRLRGIIEQEEFQSHASITELGNFFVGRYLGNSAFDARNIFSWWWDILRPSVAGKQSVRPRIWST